MTEKELSKAAAFGRRKKLKSQAYDEIKKNIYSLEKVTKIVQETEIELDKLRKYKKNNI